MRKDLACDIQDERVKFCAEERMSLRERTCQERSIYTAIAAGLKPVIAGEFSILREVEQLTEVMNKMNKIIFDPFKDILDRENKTSFVDNIKDIYIFLTPPSTPCGSVMGSRSSSIKSINSFLRASQLTGSINLETDCYRSRNGSVSSLQVNYYLFLFV